MSQLIFAHYWKNNLFHNTDMQQNSYNQDDKYINKISFFFFKCFEEKRSSLHTPSSVAQLWNFTIGAEFIECNEKSCCLISLWCEGWTICHSALS